MPQVIISEKLVPKLDAYGLFDALHNVSETRHIPIILLSKNTDMEEEAKAFEKGFFDFMFKPVNEVTLKTRVNRAFQYLEREYGMIF
jgi:PleD family two-component response regulator